MSNLLHLIHHQAVINEGQGTIRLALDLGAIEKSNKKDNDMRSAIIQAFFYGCMYGKQQDRKRRKKKGIHKEKIGFSYMPTAAESEQINRAYERGTGDHDRALENVYLLGRVHGAKSKQARQAVAL